MATGGNSKGEHTPDPEEEEEDEFVGPIPIQQKTKKRRGLLIKYHCFISFESFSSLTEGAECMVCTEALM